jgi:hypothetical protein
MALTFALNRAVLHVTEVLHSFTTTQTNHWYYNLTTWETSLNGRLADECIRPMDVKKHYLNKIEGYDNEK